MGKMEKIDVFIIDFYSTTSLILLESQHTNLLNDSKKYLFELNDVRRCRSTFIDVLDFPKNEFNG